MTKDLSVIPMVCGNPKCEQTEQKITEKMFALVVMCEVTRLVGVAECHNILLAGVLNCHFSRDNRFVSLEDLGQLG